MSCRLCLKKSDYTETVLKNNIPKKIKECLSIDVLDCEDLPSKLCLECHKSLEEFWSFRYVSLLADRILRNALQNNTLYVFLNDGETETNIDDKILCKNDNDHVFEENCIDYEDASTELLNTIVQTGEIQKSDYSNEFQIKLKELDNSDVKEHAYLQEDTGRPEKIINEITQGDEHIIFQDEENDEETVFTCDICDDEFPSEVEFMNHQTSHFTNEFKCSTCKKVFPSRPQLLEHTETHQVHCPICNKVMLKSSLNLHFFKHTDRYKCPLCPTRSTSKTTFDIHMASVHEKSKEQICRWCKKGFSSVSLLNTHLKTHSDERPYKCKLCHYGGRTNSALWRHMDMHSEKVHMCEICSNLYKSKLTLKNHIRSSHFKERRHQCRECGKQFYNKYRLLRHMSYHTGEKIYVCEICGKRFARKDGLKDHLITHESQSFSCQRCHKKFSCKRSVKRHVCSY